MNISTFSEVFFNKMLSSGVSEHFSMSGDGNGVFFQLTNAITQYYFSEYPLRSEGNKTAQHASFFIPSSIFITPWCAKISIRIDSFILLWWKRESNAKNDTWPHPISWSGFCFKCCQKELFSFWFLTHLLCCFSLWCFSKINTIFCF